MLKLLKYYAIKQRYQKVPILFSIQILFCQIRLVNTSRYLLYEKTNERIAIMLHYLNMTHA